MSGGAPHGRRIGPELVLVRHGETEWSRDGRHTSRTDVALTDEGRRLAGRLAERLRGGRFALVLTSPRSRARETVALAGLDAGAEVLDDLREVDYGRYEGLRTVEIRRERPGWDLWRDGCPEGETVAQAGVRADRAIERALAAGGDVAIFAHGHMLRILGARWLGLPAEVGGNLALDTGAVCVLGHERDRRAVWLWNDTGYAAE